MSAEKGFSAEQFSLNGDVPDQKRKEEDLGPSLEHPDPRHIKEEQEELWTNQEGEAGISKPSRFQNLKDLFRWRLQTAAREDLTGHFETTMSGFEKEIDRQKKLLDLVLKPEIRLQRADVSEPRHIKEEQEELWTNQEGEADVTKASKFHDLKDSFKRRLLTAAREDLTGDFETTISGFEKEIDRQQKLLDLVLKPEIRLQRADVQMLVNKEEVPPEHQHPEPPHIKQEEDELWTNQEGDPLQEAAAVPVKSEDGDDEKPQSSRLHQTDGGGPEAARNSLQPDTDDMTENSSEREDKDETDHDKHWKDKNRKSFACPFCGKTFNHKGNLNIHLRTHTGVKPFSCSFCGKGFAQKVGLDYHVKTHTGEKPFGCPFCNKTYRHKAALTYHLATHSGVKPFSCSDCGKRFRGTSQLKIHQCVVSGSSQTRRKVDKGEKPLSCPECAATFPNNYLLMTHIRMHRGKKLFTCSICGAKRQFSSHLEIHMRTHTGERPYSCSVCGKRFSQRGIVKQHMAIHSGVKPFTCPDCGRGFFWQFQIKKHKCLAKPLLQRRKGGGGSERIRIFNPFRHLKREKEAMLSAEADDNVDTDFWNETRQHQSGVTYRRNKNVPVSKKTSNCADEPAKTEPKADDGINLAYCGQNHLKREASVSDPGLNSHTLRTRRKPFSCLFCKKEFASGGSLTRHISVHMGEKLLGCIVCEKTFFLKSELLSHECGGESSQHYQSQAVGPSAGNKSFSCPQCGRGFGRKQHLQTHMRSHSGEKPFSCSVCGKAFARRESLSFHMACHSGEAPFHCSVCNTGFIDSESLVKHMRIHTRQTQFSCLVCGKEFAWRRSLTKHMEVHADEKVYRCNVCGLGFSQVHQFKTHKCLGESSELCESPTEENGEEHRPSNSDQQIKTGADGEEPEPEPARVSGSDTYLQTDTHEKTESGTDDSDASWEKTRDLNCHTVETKGNHTGETLFNSPVCVDQFREGGSLNLAEAKSESPEAPQIKEEQEELWIGQQEEQLQEDLPVKTEDCDEEKPESSQLHHRLTKPIKSEADGGDCGGPEPARDSDTGDSVDSDFWKETRERPTDLNSLRNDEAPESDSGKVFNGSDDKTSEPLEAESDDSVDSDFWKDAHKPPDSRRKPYNCTECGRRFLQIHHLKNHMRFHVRQRAPFFCSVCGHQFLYKSLLKIHMRTHTGEKPFVCPVCGKKYAHKASMQSHMSIHNVEKQYSCNACDKSFAWYTELKYHQCGGES